MKLKFSKEKVELNMLEILKDYGMKKILEGLIASIPTTSERYLIQLKTNLQNTLNTYEARHNEP